MLAFIIVSCTQTSAEVENIDRSSAVVDDAVKTVTETVAQEQPQKSSPLVKVGDLLSNPDSYRGQAIMLTGKVVNACAGNG